VTAIAPGPTPTLIGLRAVLVAVRIGVTVPEPRWRRRCQHAVPDVALVADPAGRVEFVQHAGNLKHGAACRQ
jgi:hypothetical protein